MDDILTEFISQTRADPALAHDLLEAANWNLGEALAVYDGLMDTRAVVPEEQLGMVGGKEGGREGGREGGCEGKSEWERGRA